jgi:hypothetical protein
MTTDGQDAHAVASQFLLNKFDPKTIDSSIASCDRGDRPKLVRGPATVEDCATVTRLYAVVASFRRLRRSSHRARVQCLARDASAVVDVSPNFVSGTGVNDDVVFK